MSLHLALRPLSLLCAALLVACAPDTPSMPEATPTDTAQPPGASATVNAEAPAATPEIQPLYRQLPYAVNRLARTQSNMGEFPSGQRGQTVNLLSVTSVVRIHLPPPKTP